MKLIQGKVNDSYGIAFESFKSVQHGCNNGEAIEKLLAFYMAHNADFEDLVVKRGSLLAKGEA